jgi:hypothetical protein
VRLRQRRAAAKGEQDGKAEEEENDGSNDNELSGREKA